MNSWSLASRIVASVLAVVLGALVMLSLLVASFTRYEVTERLDNSLQEVGERLEFVVSGMDHRSGTPDLGGGLIAQLPHVDQRTLAYQITSPSGRVELRSQNAPDRIFVTPLRTGFYNRTNFRIYIMRSASGTHYILVGEPTFHRHEAVQRAVLISILPMIIFLPCIWLLVRWIVRRSLRPLTVLQSEIRSRGGGNLSPVPALDLPEELSAIHAAVNSLLERLKMALSTERAFAANAAHELRNPIGALLAQAQLLHRKLAGAEFGAGAQVIVQQAHRLGRTTEKLLQLSRAASGAAVKGEEIDLAHIIAILVDELDRDSRIEFPQCKQDVFPVRGDVDAVGILFRNLIENALHHSIPGTPVHIELGPGCEVSIANDCPPIEAKLLGRLYEPFVRGNSDADGSGLGLAIVTGIARQMRARIVLQSPIPGAARGFRTWIVFQRVANEL